MKKIIVALALLLAIAIAAFADGQHETQISESSRRDSRIVAEQQGIYQSAQPVPLYDYSIPRDVFIQIYDVVTTKAYVIYTVITSMTGQVIFHGPSIGYAIPADTSLTNPFTYVVARDAFEDPPVQVSQPEPNGLFQSQNTDGTWVLFLNDDGTVTPIYTEMKVTTYPFAVRQNAAGTWVRADSDPSEFVVEVTR